MKIKELTQRIKNGPKLISLTPLHRYGEEAKALGEEASGRADVPDLPNLPRHLKDYVPTFRTTKSGGSMAGIATAEDFEGLATSPASIAFFFLTVWCSYLFLGLARAFAGYSIEQLLGCMGVALVLGSIAYTVFGGSPRRAIAIGGVGLLFSALGFGSLLLNYLPIPKQYLVNPLFFSIAIAPWVWLSRGGRERGLKLLFQSRKHGGGKAILKLQGADERMTQAKQAINEANLPHVHFGQTLGVLSRSVLSPWVCDPGLPLKASIPTLSRHVFVFGSSGEGKSAFLRGIISQIYEERGMFVSDFKAALPYEVRKALHITITPQSVCNMLHEVDPTDFYTFITGEKSVDAGANSIFQTSGFTTIYASHVLLKSGVDLVKASSNGSSTRITLKSADGTPKQFAINIGGLSRFILDCRVLETRKAYFEQLTNALEVQIAQEASIGPGQLSAAIDIIKGFIQHADQELIANFYTNAITYFDDFFSNNELRLWAESETPPVDFTDCFTKKLRVGVALGDIQGATGSLYLAMFHQRFKKVAKKLSVEVSEKTRDRAGMNPVLYVIDECASVFKFDKSDGLGDDQMVSIFRSLMVECVFACQSASQLIGRFNESKMKAFFSNIGSVFTYFTKENETYKIMAERVGNRPKIKHQNSSFSTLDFAETYNVKASNSIYDLSNPNRADMLALTGPMGVKSSYAWGKLEVPEFPIVTQNLDAHTTEPALDLETYTRWIQSPRVAFASVLVSGGYRQDFIKPYAVDENFEPYDIASKLAKDEASKLIHDAEEAGKHIEAGDYMSAARMLEEAI